jgi:hypothetical protein
MVNSKRRSNTQRQRNKAAIGNTKRRNKKKENIKRKLPLKFVG